MDWQLQDAKARLSEVIGKARHEGPQRITVRGKPAAVVVSEEEYRELCGTQESLVEFMRRSPLFDAQDVKFVRDQSLTRAVDL